MEPPPLTVMAAESLKKSTALWAEVTPPPVLMEPPLSVMPEVKPNARFPVAPSTESLIPPLTVVVPDQPVVLAPVKVMVEPPGFCAVKVMFAALVPIVPVMVAAVTRLLRATVLLVAPKVRAFAPVVML